jgi:transcriptional regulator with XRE-family HTH domain
MARIVEAVLRTGASLPRHRGGGGSLISAELKALRSDLGMSQREFAETYGLALATLQTWESPAKGGNPDLAARLLIDMIKIDPKGVASLVRRTKIARLSEEGARVRQEELEDA